MSCPCGAGREGKQCYHDPSYKPRFRRAIGEPEPPSLQEQIQAGVDRAFAAHEKTNGHEHKELTPEQKKAAAAQLREAAERVEMG